MTRGLDELGQLLDVVARLRGPGGCPWDRKQTLRDVSRYLLEEASELADAADECGEQPTAEVCEELGDVLMNVLLLSEIASETRRDRGGFSIAEVAAGIREKLVRRHPHVFGSRVVDGVDDVIKSWEEIKRAEQAAGGDASGPPRESRLDGVPRSLPPMARAYRVSARAARCGFDWSDPSNVIEKVREELGEVCAALRSSQPKDTGGEPEDACDESSRELEGELGDLLFSVVNLCRKVHIHPDHALRATVRKFTARFRRMEERLGNLEAATLEEMEAVWNEARREGVGSADDAASSQRTREVS